MELEPMEDIKAAIVELAKKANAVNTTGHEAMQFAQAALNLAHAYQTVKEASNNGKDNQ
jgi:hypothetical protein